MKSNDRLSGVVLVLLFAPTGSAFAAVFDLSWYSMDCGGVMNSASGTLELSGTIGQHDSGILSGGTFEISGGFWVGAISTPPSCEGDANGDGVVDPLDAGFVLARFNCSVGSGNSECDDADQNDDGVVDPLDAGFVLARFGECS